MQGIITFENLALFVFLLLIPQRVQTEKHCHERTMLCEKYSFKVKQG